MFALKNVADNVFMIIKSDTLKGGFFKKLPISMNNSVSFGPY